MGPLQDAVDRLLSAVASACIRAGRDPGEVTIVAATKTVPVPVVARARELGLAHFAENYASELVRKAPLVDATWHFVGKLQSGTARHVARLADVVHSAEPGGGLETLTRRAGELGRQIDALVQVDFAGNRQGVPPGDVLSFVEGMEGTGAIRLVGLMTLPPMTSGAEEARTYFRRLRELRDELAELWPGRGELSMGMSADYAIAVEEGATMVRVGTALFGKRAGQASGSPPGRGDAPLRRRAWPE